ncbi:MAG: CxxC-x17-CxxC domain-containing protein [Candidatus Paceibacterota bacterium]|jgi:CxxC-x17-CxxC domain-containing protein
MGKFNRDGGSGFGGNRGGGSSFGGGRRDGGFRGGERREVVMHDAVCDECHQACQIPFRPSGDKPVYCKDCFMKKGGGPSRPSRDNGPRRDFGRPQSAPSFGGNRSDDGVKKQLEAMNVKLDSLIRSIDGFVKPTKVEEKKTIEKVADRKIKVKTVAKKKTIKK